MYSYVKRFSDIVVSSLALVALSPLFVLLALWVRLDSKGPAFFKQARYGKHRKVFFIYKFRSMHVTAPKHMPPNKLRNASDHITRVGSILRRTSLDELPQLLNILKGDMSFVGPRPGSARNEEDLAAARDKSGAFMVLPGITGWAQVNGRDELAHNIEEKAYMDGLYAKNFGARMDILCLMRTFETVILMKGYQEGSIEDIVASEKRKIKLATSKTQTGMQKTSIFKRVTRKVTTNRYSKGIVRRISTVKGGRE